MPIDIKVNINKEYVLSRVSQEQIFERYLGLPIDTTVSFRNPLRDDSSPGCRFYYDNRSVLKFHDMSRHWNWDCFNLVQFINNCSFLEALKIIANDFSVNTITTLSNYNSEPLNKRPCEIKIASVEWNSKNIKFWEKYYIDKDLLYEFNVKPIKAYWLNNIRYNIGVNENAYAYLFYGGRIKIYLPDREYNRFYQNASYIIQGMEQLPESGKDIVITKSYKDVISLRSFEIISIALPSENSYIVPELYDTISARFDNIYMLYDNDWAGKRALVRNVSQYPNIIPLIFPNDMKKDWTDNLEKYGQQFMIDILENTKDYFQE